MVFKILKHLEFIIAFKWKYISFLKEYYFIKRQFHRSLKNNIAILKERLFNILHYAINNIPYYKRISKNRQIKLSKETIFNDLKQFPILTKEIIRKNWNDLCSDLQNKKYILNTSGGTTGEPVKFVQGQNYVIKNFASTLAFNEIADYQYGDKLIKLWASERDLKGKQEGTFMKFINRYISKIYLLNGLNLSDDRIRRYLKEIRRIKPKIILSYVQSISELAKYIKKNNLNPPKIKSILTSATTLSYELKRFLESTFNCNVYNRYGSREVGLIASSCRESDKLHINMLQKYIEILDNKQKPVKEHTKGNIIVTNLTNYAMPLIRYKIGDVGSLNLSKEKCGCGNKFLQLDAVHGRITDIFKTPSGKKIYGGFFTHLFYFRNNIKKFQVIQKEIDKIVIKIQTINNKSLNCSNERDLIQKVQKVIGKDVRIEIKYVNQIKPSRSGKFRYTISRIE
jgi:phenylacetate-CoA ligase